MSLRLAHVRVVPPPAERPASALMPLKAVIDVLQDSVNVAHEGVVNPGAFSVDFIERHVIPHLQEKQRLWSSSVL